MTRFLSILLFFAFAAPPALAQQTAIPNQPELTVSLQPRHVKTGGAYVQGQIRLRVQLVSPHPFEALQLDLPPIAAARTLTLSQPHTRKIHNFSREGYVYETRLALFPESRSDEEQRDSSPHGKIISVIFPSSSAASAAADQRVGQSQLPGFCGRKLASDLLRKNISPMHRNKKLHASYLPG